MPRSRFPPALYAVMQMNSAAAARPLADDATVAPSTPREPMAKAAVIAIRGFARPLGRGRYGL